MNMSSIKLVIFDCDGVLIDSEIISASILIDQLAALGVAIDLGYVQEHFLGRSFPSVVVDIRKSFGLDLQPEFEDNYRQKLLSIFENELQVTEGLENVLDALSCKSCVATSSSPKRVKRSLELVGLNGYFGENVFTASEVKNGKPAPDLFLHTANSMGVSVENCLVIEDSVTGVRAALAANMNVWRFMGGSHLDSISRSPENNLPGIQIFDKWSNFFDIAPELKMISVT